MMNEYLDSIDSEHQRQANAALIVDDHPIIIESFRLFAEDIGISHVLEARDIRSGCRAYHRYRPGLVVADLSFGDKNLAGLMLIRRIHLLQSSAHILVFSMHDDPAIIEQSLKCGALGFVVKDAPMHVFLEALNSVCSGQKYISNTNSQ